MKMRLFYLIVPKNVKKINILVLKETRVIIVDQDSRDGKKS